MPHISKQKIDAVLLEKLFVELEKLVAQTTARESSQVLATLLTPTERIMLTKRLTAALMFSQGYSQYQVWNILKISPSTAQRLFLSYENGIYNKLIKIVNRQPHEKIWETLDLILRGGLPSMGKNRWKILDTK